MKIGLFDPGIEDNHGTSSSNLGDLIIQAAVDRELKRTFGDAEIFRITTQAPVPRDYFPRMKECEHLLVGGTNLLSSFMREYKQWQITWQDAWRIRRAILLGIGWWQYQPPPDRYTRFVLRGALSWGGLHSVRDEYTRRMLITAGIKNVINTGCPTMWPFLEFDQSTVPVAKAPEVLLMLTDYYRAPEADKALVELLLASYGKVYFWPQGRKDLEYMNELNYPVVRLEHTMDSLNEFLRTGPVVDYVGTRLHGGVHCTLSRKRSLVLEIDNRAAEMGRDTGLAVVKRTDIEAIRKWIDEPRPCNIRMNADAIQKWRSQFTRQ